jgi:hypothetical protein
MKDARRYQRYTVHYDVKKPHRGKVTVGGKLVLLLDFSLSGLCVLSKNPFSSGAVSVSVEFEDQGKIDLIGRVARIKQEGNMWRIAIDLTKTYKLDTLREV